MKNTIPAFNRENAIALKEILGPPDPQSESLSYCETIGFLFVLACSPEAVNPNQWLPVVLNLADTEDPGQAGTHKKIELVIGLYNEINRQVQDADIALLPGCEFRDEVMDNFDDDAPIRQWATGFIIGHDWQSRVLTQYTPEDLQNELAGHMMVLSFFANREIASRFAAETKNADATVESMAGDMQNLFVDAMSGLAHLAKIIQQVLQEKNATAQQPAQSEKIGRNEPCSCGSGKKYKKCCGSALN